MSSHVFYFPDGRSMNFYQIAHVHVRPDASVDLIDAEGDNIYVRGYEVWIRTEHQETQEKN